MQTLRVFISSPGDVADERQIAGKVIERLQGKYWSFVRLDDVFWEQKVIRSTAHYQDELANPGDCEMVVGILWSRLGSLMPEKFRKQSGERYQSGTEWELEMAFDAYEKSLARTGDPVAAKPDIIIYRRNQAHPHFEDPEQETLAAEQVAKLNAYLRENFWFADGTIKRPITNYDTLTEFEEKLSRNLEELILRQIPGLKPGFEPPPISGSPFKGLQAFDFADSDRYFGRNREIREIQQRLIANACKGLPFVLIYGGSGYGKSSLMRAGLVPVLTRPGGSLDKIQGWRRVYFQPAKGSGNLCERLARALIQAPTQEEVEHSGLHRHWPLTGLPELADFCVDGTPWDSARLTRHFSDDDQRVLAIAAVTDTLASLTRHLLLEIDQLEEMFTTPGIDAEQRAAFLRTIGDLCLSGRVWVVATMRSEFFPRVAEQAELFALVGKERSYILPPPDRQSLREIIRYPVLAARLDFERRVAEIQIAGENAKHDYLHDQILSDAESSPDALPLLEFTLQQLYESRRGTLLTWEAYAAAGGLKGAIAKRAREVYDGLGPVARDARHRIFAALVHVDAARNTVTRQRAPLEILRTAPGADNFLQAFLGNHLLVTDEDALTGDAIVTLAHEALLSHWDELSTWINDHRGDLLARQRLAEQTQLWIENGMRKSYLLSEARLAEAERVNESSLFHLAIEQSQFLRASERRARRKLRLLQGAVSLFAIIAVAAAFFAWRSEIEAERAEKQTKVAETETKKAVASESKARAGLKEASVKSHGRARQAFGAGDPRTGMAYLAESLSYDPDNESARLDSVQRLLRLGSLKRSLSAPPLGHRGRVTEAVFSPDGNRVATASDDGAVRIWEATSGKPMGEPLRHQDSIYGGIDFSPDGSRIATAASGRAHLWDATSGKPLDLTFEHKDVVTSVSFSPDGTRIITTSWDKTARVWDAASGKPIGEALAHRDEVNAASFSPDGNLVVTASEDTTARIWDAATGKPVGDPLPHQGAVATVSFSPDGTHVVTASEDTTARIWSIPSGKPVGEPLRHNGRVMHAVFSPDGTRVATGSEDNTARIWDAATGMPQTEPLRHGNTVLHVAFSPEGARVATASEDKTARMWDAASGKSLGEPVVHKSTIRSIEFSSDGSSVLTASDDNTAGIWDAVSPSMAVGLPLRHEAWVFGACFSPDGSRVLTASDDAAARIWHAESGEPVGLALQHDASVRTAVFSSDGALVVTASDDATARVWDASSGKPVSPPLKHEDIVFSACFSPDNTKILTSSLDNTARIWETSSGKPLGEPFVHQAQVRQASFNSDASRLVTVCNDKTARIWDSTTGKLVCDPLKHEEAVFTASFSPDGNFIVTSSWDKTARVWDASSGKPVSPPLKHEGVVSSASFNPAGTHVVTSSWDKTARVWDAASGEPVGEPLEHESPVLGAAFSPDGTLVVTASDDKTARVWDAFSGAPLGETIRHEEAVLAASFSMDGRRVVTASSDTTARVWDTARIDDLANDVLLGDWLVEAAGKKIAVDGSAEEIDRSGPLESKPWISHQSAQPSEGKRRLIDWLNSPPTKRALSPFGSFTVTEYVAREIDWCFEHPTSNQCVSIIRKLSPLVSASPLMPFALALIEDNPARKAFLIDYGLTQLPVTSDYLLKAANYLSILDAPGPALQTVDKFLGNFPANASAFRIRIRALSELDRDEEALAVYSQLLSSDGATAEDFRDGGYMASSLNRADLVARWFAAAVAKDPGNDSMPRLHGWSLINLGDHSGALSAFEKSRSLLPAGHKPSSGLLAGLAISQWLAGNRQQAIAYFLELIETGREQSPPNDWTDSEFLTELNWSAAQSAPLREVCAATIRAHPERATKIPPSDR